MNRGTIDRLAQLARELDDAGRGDMAEAVRDAVNELRPAGLITTGEAAERLNVALTTVRRWVERGVLEGVDTGTRLLVSQESVDRILKARQLQREMDAEGISTEGELYELTRRVRRQMNAERPGGQGKIAAG
ncbi:MAG: helix-turn-helix domain-containing protein [Chloroflexota bacterium]